MQSALATSFTFKKLCDPYVLSHQGRNRICQERGTSLGGLHALSHGDIVTLQSHHIHTTSSWPVSWARWLTAGVDGRVQKKVQIHPCGKGNKWMTSQCEVRKRVSFEAVELKLQRKVKGLGIWTACLRALLHPVTYQICSSTGSPRHMVILWCRHLAYFPKYPERPKDGTVNVVY